VTTAIVFALLQPLPRFFSEISIVEFFTAVEWSPGFARPQYGVMPIVVGTLMVVVTALSVAIPLGLLSAIYLSEYAPEAVRKTIKPILEVLEGIPTVAVGLFAFFWLRPFIEYLTPWLPWGGLFSTGVAGIAVGLIIVPLISSVADDAMRSVPRALREGAYALGAGKMRVALRVVVPAAFSGIIAAFVLGASRAVGETMVVLLVAGAGSPQLNFNPFEGVQTMTAYIASRATGEIAVGSIVYDTIFAVGALLFTITLAMNMLAIRFVNRFREVYD
jgi:phosphate transport system permease protein